MRTSLLYYSLYLWVIQMCVCVCVCCVVVNSMHVVNVYVQNI